MSKKVIRVFGRAFKLAAVRRMLAGENVSALARELRVLRKDLYKWRYNFRARGPDGLRSHGRPQKGETVRMAAGDTPASAPDGEFPEARRTIGAFIADVYNGQRLHSTSTIDRPPSSRQA
jgi:transposase-like protein